jgi:hypothetical protein
MIAVCIFTFSRDAMPLRECIRSVLLADCIPVICDDAGNPLPGWMRGWLDHHGIDYRQTEWPRRGNLHGTDVAAGICDEMADAAERHGTGNAMKLDSDTILIEPAWFAGNTCFTSILQLQRDAYGCSYALETSAARKVAKHLRQTHPQPNPKAPEDLTIWRTMAQLGIPHFVHEFDPDEGPFCAAPVGADPSDNCRRFGAITFGNEPEGGWTDRPLQTASEMRRFVNWLEAHPATTYLSNDLR